MRPGRAPQVVIIDVGDTEQSILALLFWIDQRYPGSKILHVKMVGNNGRIYNQITLRRANGQIRTVFFDVTRTFHENGGTRFLLRAQGTLATRAFFTTQNLR